jgi:ribosome-associated translation inhibitor RaiA
MNIQFNTDRNIDGNERLASYVKTSISEGLSHFRNQITRIEVHLSDENGKKTGQDDKRCLLEARMENRQPIAVTSHANTIEDAVSSALDKLKKTLETIYSNLKHN